MKARNTLIPLALFALAFVGALFAMKRATPVAAAPATPSATSMALLPRIAAVSRTPPARETAIAPEGIAAPGVTGLDGDRPAAPGAGPVVEAPVAEATPPPADDTPLPSVRESFALLKNFGTTEERVRAIQAIAEAAGRGSEVARARQTLRLAAADPDPEVAARAQEEYEQLAERDDR